VGELRPIIRSVAPAADRVLLERGELDPFECLLELGAIHYPDYANWRRGAGTELASALAQPIDGVTAALEAIQTYGRAQGLVCRLQPALRWDGSGTELPLGGPLLFQSLCRQILGPPERKSQLDLFQDNTALLRSRDLRNALAEHRLDAVRALLAQGTNLKINAGEHAAYLRLMDAAQESVLNPEQRLHQLETDIIPLARTRLGPRARDFLAPLWQALGERLEPKPYAPGQPRLHSSYAYAKAGNWQQVAATIEREPSADDDIDLIARHAEASFRLHHADAARRLWARLFWRAPEAAAKQIEQVQYDAVLQDRWNAFITAEPPLPYEDFPAWLLLVSPGQRAAVLPALAPDAPVGHRYATLHKLVGAKGDIDIAARKSLKTQSPELLAHYKMYLERGGRE
jgi:hypothetical protein